MPPPLVKMLVDFGLFAVNLYLRDNGEKSEWKQKMFRTAHIFITLAIAASQNDFRRSSVFVS